MIDLHTHSTCSDGTLTPEAVVQEARARGLEGLALTDHDTLAGIAAAQAAATAQGLRFLSGIELSTAHGAVRDVHLLGYAVTGPDKEPLARACASLRAARQERGSLIVQRLQAAGAQIEWQSVLDLAGTAPVGRPHIARALIAVGKASDIKDAFQRWLVPGAPGYEPNDKFATRAAVRLLRDCRALPVLAHPGSLKLTEVDLEHVVKELVDAGLGGLESYWSKHEESSVVLCERLARHFGLMNTGGSDFHGANKPEISLGQLADGRRLPVGLITDIEAVAAAWQSSTQAGAVVSG